MDIEPQNRDISFVPFEGAPAICDDCSRVTNLLNRPGVPFGLAERDPLLFEMI